MASYLASYLPAIQSVLPRSSPATAPFPALGAPAPAPTGDLDLTHRRGQPTLVAFVRHCGCPFAAKEVQLLGAEARKNSTLHVVIVQHSAPAATQAWFARIGGHDAFPDGGRYTLVADPERKVYAAWGVGVLGWGGMVNSGSFGALKALQDEGIGLTETGEGSWRWQNSGGFAVDGEGTIRWRKLAVDSADMCDYAEAAATVV